jgi:hypothetical protein
MFVSNLCVRTGRILSLIDWEEVSKIVFHGLIALMVGIWVAGETLGHWVHRLNDWLAHHWVQLIVPQTSVETEQALIIVEEVSTTTLPIAVEVEPKLPPATTEVVETPVLDEPPPTSPCKRRRQSAPPTAVVVTEELELLQKRRPHGRRAHERRHEAA